MKKMLKLLPFLIFPLYANNIETNLTDNQIEMISQDLEFIIKERTTQRFFYPGRYKKIISADITLNGTEFTYDLRYVWQRHNYEGEDFTPYYTDVSVEGSITNLMKTSNDDYSVQISAFSTILQEYFNYYGPKDSKETSREERQINFAFDFNRETLRESLEDDSLYYWGTTRKFDREILKDLTLDELGYLRNEFFARKGFIFRTEKMISYFSDKTWYIPTTRNVSMSEIETYNIEFIREIEQELNLGANAADVNQINDLYRLAQMRLLTENDLKALSPHKLPYLRNTFYARKGFIFYSLRYRDFFQAQDWYTPSLKDVDHLLSERDKENIELILSHEVRH